MGFYTISSSNTGKFNALHVNASAPSQFSEGLNVDLSSKVLFNIPVNVWYIGALGNNVQIQCAANMRYRLGMNASTQNCDVRLKNNASYVNIKTVPGEQGKYRIQLVNKPNMYLTVENVGATENVYWAELDDSNTRQKWTISEVTCEHVYANDWLRMRTTPSATGGRDVLMPTVAPFKETFTTDKGTFTYSFTFTDKNNWATFQPNMEATKINIYAYNEIKRKTGKYPVVNVGEVAGLTDEAGRYWIAVGPNVVNPDHKPSEIPTPEEMYAHGTLDVVIKDEYGTTFYIPAVVGGTKAHTYQNGIIQTWISFETPDETYNPGGDYNGLVCAEFINVAKNDFNGMQKGFFSIEKIIFYSSK